MAYFAPGHRSQTAWAMTWAVEWRRTVRSSASITPVPRSVQGVLDPLRPSSLKLLEADSKCRAHGAIDMISPGPRAPTLGAELRVEPCDRFLAELLGGVSDGRRRLLVGGEDHRIRTGYELVVEGQQLIEQPVLYPARQHGRRIVTGDPLGHAFLHEDGDERARVLASGDVEQLVGENGPSGGLVVQGECGPVEKDAVADEIPISGAVDTRGGKRNEHVEVECGLDESAQLRRSAWGKDDHFLAPSERPLLRDRVQRLLRGLQ